LDKKQYEQMEVLEQLNFINELLSKGENLTKVAQSLGMSRSSIARNFKKISYTYDSTTKQYAKSNVTQELKKDNTINIGNNKKLDYKLDHRLDHRPVFNIPIKTNLKATTKAFNVVMDKVLVDKIDKLCKTKGGYSRTEMINRMCEFAIDNIE